MVFKAAVVSRPDWDLNPQTLNSIQMLTDSAIRP